MHSITLDIASGVLLLSSVFYLVFFLKKTPTSSLKSSISVLSISDVANSIVTALMILFYQIHYKNNNYFDQLIAEENESIEVDDLFVKNRAYFREATANSSFSENCDNRGTFLQYAIFFVPFTNAFVSLIGFSVSFYASASKVNQKCCKLIAKKIDVLENPETSQKELGTKVQQKKYTGIAVFSQWLLPLIFSAVFQAGQHEKIQLSGGSSDELVCSLAANFPFENWMSELNFTVVDLIKGLPASENYVGDEENLAWPNPNSSKVDEVLSKIYQVVQEARNDSETTRESPGHFNISQILGIANVKDNSLNRNLSDDNNYLEWQARLFEKVLKKSYGTGKVSDGRRYKQYDTDLLVDASDQNKTVYVSGGTTTLQSMENRCVTSVTFLKVNLFLILSLIYFLPIFASSLLLVISYYKCRETTAKLMYGGEPKDVEKSAESTKSKDENGWFPPETITDGMASEAEDRVTCSEFDVAKCELYCKIERTKNFSKIFRINLLAAVVLWTPFFMSVLSKVFFCSSVPSWITETAFLAAAFFAVFRNIIYANIFKMKSEDSKKANSVHPDT